MRILDRLVASSFLRLFLLFIVGASILFVIGDITERVDAYLDRGITGIDLARAYVFMLPKFILWSFPIAALIAAVFTVHGMTTHREVVAAKAGGISFYRLIAPILTLGVLLTGIGLVLADWVPRSNLIAAEILEERDPRRDWRTDFVYQTEDGRTLSIRRLRVADRVIRGVSMTSGDPGSEEAMTHVVARYARWSPERGWVFEGGYLRKILPDGSETTTGFDRLRTPGFDERPEDLLEEPRDEELMTYDEMGRLADVVRRSGGNPQQLLVEREQKMAIPAATLVIVLFGAPLATSSKRGGAAFGVGASLGSTILYMILLRVFGAIGESGGLPPLIAAWAPNLVFLAAGLVLLARVRT